MELKNKLNKPYTEQERIEFIVRNNHNNGYEIRETETELQAWGNDENDKFLIAKENKILLNDELRDMALMSGVVYKDVLFDSDTDQKVNLLATVSILPDGDSIVWYGMDNNGLLCDKEDLMNIGYLITQLHTYCWTHNAEIKQAIEQSTTLEELERIEINYDQMDNE